MVKSRKNIKLTIEYNGTAYSGWQFQPNATTIQGEIEKALAVITSQKVTLFGAGRTDAGVHALGQVANFIVEHTLPAQKYQDALNFYLPHDILIRSAEEVPLDFHARYDAVYRRYQYLIGLEKSALYRDMRWEINRRPDFARLSESAAYIVGEHDFTACCVVNSQKESNRCIVYRSEWTEQGRALKFEITADRFVHSMIRSLVGLMIEYGCGGIIKNEFIRIFTGGDHTAIPKVAPARGLCLAEVGY